MAKPRPPFGILLRTKRKACGLTQRDLAAKLHLSHVYVGEVERGKSAPMNRNHWPTLVKHIRDLTLFDLERAAAASVPLEVDLQKAPVEHVDLALALIEGIRNRDLEAVDVEAMLGMLKTASRGPVRAHGRVVDRAGAPVSGAFYVYRLSRSRGWAAVVGARSHAGRTAGPLDGHIAVLTDKKADLVKAGDPRRQGLFDIPGGLAPGSYALDVHVDGGQDWAWPLVVTDGSETQDVRLGGSEPAPPPAAPTRSRS